MITALCGGKDINHTLYRRLYWEECSLWKWRGRWFTPWQAFALCGIHIALERDLRCGLLLPWWCACVCTNHILSWKVAGASSWGLRVINLCMWGSEPWGLEVLTLVLSEEAGFIAMSMWQLPELSLIPFDHFCCQCSYGHSLGMSCSWASNICAYQEIDLKLLAERNLPLPATSSPATHFLGNSVLLWASLCFAGHLLQ